MTLNRVPDGDVVRPPYVRGKEPSITREGEALDASGSGEAMHFLSAPSVPKHNVARVIGCVVEGQRVGIGCEREPPPGKSFKSFKARKQLAFTNVPDGHFIWESPSYCEQTSIARE